MALATDMVEAASPRASACTALGRVLADGNDAQRCCAVRALGRIGDPAAVGRLIEALMDEDEDVRADAAEALGRLGDDRSGPALIDTLLQDPSGDAKAHAIAALVCIGNADVVPILRTLARERGETVVWDEEEFLHGGWDDWLDIQIKAIEALGVLGVAEAVPDLMATLDDEMGQDVSPAVVKALAQLGDAGIAALGDCLRSDDDRLRRRAAMALAGAGSMAAADLLADYRTDPLPDVRLAAAQALAAMDTSDPRLAALLDDADPGVRAVLVALCGAAFPDRLDRLFDDADGSVQQAVIDLLAADAGVPHPENFQQRLRVKLRGPSEAVAVTVASVLPDLAPDVARADLLEQMQDANCPVSVREAAIGALPRAADASVAADLGAAMADEDRRIRLAAIAALATLACGPGQEADLARNLLVQAVESAPSPQSDDGAADPESALPEPPAASPTSTLDVIMAGGSTTAGTQPDEAAGDLTPEDLDFIEMAGRSPRRSKLSLEAAETVHRDARLFAASLLGDLPGDAMLPALTAALSSNDSGLRRAAAASLGRLAVRDNSLPDSATTSLANALTDQDPDVRLEAVRAVAICGDAATLSPLQRDDNAAVRAEAVKTLAAQGIDPSAHLQDADPGVRLTAAEALAAGGAPDTVDRLIALALDHDGYQRLDAARLLRAVDADAAAARFIDLLDDPNRRRTWRIAIEVLEGLYATY